VSETAQVELKMDECKPLLNGVAKAMNPLRDETNKAGVSIIQKRVEVGRCRLTLSNPC